MCMYDGATGCRLSVAWREGSPGPSLAGYPSASDGSNRHKEAPGRQYRVPVKRCLVGILVALAACSTSPTAGPSEADRSAFCDPVVAVYEHIDPSDLASVRAVVGAISENALGLDEINRATFVAIGAELQVTLTAGNWSTIRLVDELEALCAVSLPVWSSP